jgi:DMSO reductase anchor subunit
LSFSARTGPPDSESPIGTNAIKRLSKNSVTATSTFRKNLVHLKQVFANHGLTFISIFIAGASHITAFSTWNSAFTKISFFLINCMNGQILALLFSPHQDDLPFFCL